MTQTMFLSCYASKDESFYASRVCMLTTNCNPMGIL